MVDQDIETVLLLEDSPTQSAITRTFLDDANYRSICVKTLKETVEALQNSVDYVALILDLNVPDSYGLNTLHKLTPLVSDSPIIVLTGLEDESLAIKALKMGAQDYLLKENLSASMITRTIHYSKERHNITKKNLELTKALEKSKNGLEKAVLERTKELEIALKKSQDYAEELGKFAYISSHDLRSPLRAIHSLLSFIEEDDQNTFSETSKKDLLTIRGRISRMNELVEDLLQYSQIGHNDYSPEEVDLNKLLKDIIDLIEIPEGFEVRLNNNLPTFSTNRPPLKQIFMNLIANAINHHNDPEHGIIRISCFETDEFYEFEVADNGPGIPEKYQEDVFQMFKKLSSNNDGSGMGLAFVSKTLRLYEGKITLKSTSGQGAKFRFTWPK